MFERFIYILFFIFSSFIVCFAEQLDNIPEEIVIAGLGQEDGIIEFINMESHFLFTQEKQDIKTITRIYGSPKHLAGDFATPIYNTGEDFFLKIEFIPSVFKKYKKKILNSKPDLNLSDIYIPIKIEITNKNCICKLIESDYTSEINKEEQEGSSVYSFLIKNNTTPIPYVYFVFQGLNANTTDQVFITYGNEDYKIVDETCNVFETIKFISR